MDKSFSFKTFLLSVIVGFVIVFSFVCATGHRFEEIFFPVVSLLTGFIVTGFIVALFSKGVTILEPGIGAAIVAIIVYFLINSMQMKGFAEINQGSDWLMIMMNGIILTFVGAWLGEKFQNDKPHSDDKPTLDTSWILAGTVFGVLISMIVGIIVDYIFGNNPIYFIIPFFIALYFSGLLSGLKSAGVTTKEAGITGFLIMNIIFAIVRISLVSEIEMEYIAGGLILGYITALLGGWSGEKLQAKKKP